MLLVIVVALIVAGVSTALTNEITRAGDPPVGGNGAPVEAEVEFTVEAGETLPSIANRLIANRLISNTLLFRLVAEQQDLDEALQPGTYILSRDMSISEIIQELSADRDAAGTDAETPPEAEEGTSD